MGATDGGLSKPQLQELERTALLAGLPRRHRRRVSGLAEAASFGPGATIVRAGDAGDAFFVVVQGEAQVETEDGEKLTLGPGDHFGELSLVDGEPRAATVRALSDVALARIPRDEFRDLLASEPELAAGLLPGLALVARDLLRTDAGRVPDHGAVGPWRRAGEGAPVPSADAGDLLEGRDALGWLLLLRHVGLFSALPDEHLRRVAAHFGIVRYGDGATVVLAGAKGDAMFVVLDGSARVRTPGGHIRLLGADDCFGELALIDGAPRSATVSTVGQLTAAKLGRKDFQKLLKDEPGMALGLLEGLTRTVRDMQRARVV